MRVRPNRIPAPTKLRRARQMMMEASRKRRRIPLLATTPPRTGTPTATIEQVAAAHAYVRTWIGKKFGQESTQTLRILYGGSVKPDNVKAIMALRDVDGVLVGEASLQPDTFLPIIEFDA